MKHLLNRIPWSALAANWPRWTLVGTGFVVFTCGAWWRQVSLLAVGAVAMIVTLTSLGEMISDRLRQAAAFRHRLRRRSALASPSGAKPDSAIATLIGDALDPPEPSVPPESANELVDEMLAMGRYALLLRPEMQRHLDREDVVRAVRSLDDAMALVPAGRVYLGPLAEQSSSSGGMVDADHKAFQRYMQPVEALYLDRYAVTNEEFYRFVASGGYEKLEFWDEEALPALLDFVDRTGEPGPRYWQLGHFSSGHERQPVVGVSWYEASAYARWVGKRLPTDAEWTKAGAWPVESAPGRIAQRRYPWGESFDIRRANLWGARRGGPVDVDEYIEGESVGGVHQLVGNAWEWTSSALGQSADPSLQVPETYKSVRGGAFDTYFENHATCHYQSGDHPLARRTNIGFRLALPMAVLESAADQPLDDAVPGAPLVSDALADQSVTAEV